MLIYLAVLFFLLLILIFTLFFERSFFGGKTYQLNVDGIKRSYKVHPPKGYKKENKYSLVVVLHALGDSPTLVELNSGFSKKADKEKFIALYPKGTGKKLSWNAKFCCGQAFKQKVDDSKFIDTVVKTVEKDFAVNKEKIFVVGFSNGGMLAYNLAKDLTYIKGIGVITGSAGTNKDSVLKPGKDIATIVFHGQNDKTVPISGGGESGFLSLDKSLQNYTGTKSSQKIEENAYFTKIAYKQDLVVLYIVKDRGHVWFGGLQDYIFNIKQPNIFATDVIWDFFKNLR